MEVCGCNSFRHFPPVPCPLPEPPCCCPEESALDLLAASNPTAQTTPSGASPVDFAHNDLVIGRAISHAPGTGDFIIHRPGVYQIQYHTLAGSVAAALPAQVAAVLSVQDVPLEGTYDQGVVTAENPAASLNGVAAVRISAVPEILSLLNLSGAARYHASTMLIQRLS